jgi:enediyne biosynthesis protein E4
MKSLPAQHSFNPLLNKFLIPALFLFIIGCAQESTPKRSLEAVDLFITYDQGGIALDGGLTRGVAWGDVDQDGAPELYTANSKGQWNVFYKNNGRGYLKKMTEDQGKTFAESVVHGGASQGVNWVDYDGDGDLDLYICTRGYESNQLFANDSSKRFLRIENHPLTQDSVSSSMACWADFDRDGDLDVLLIGYRFNGNKLYENLGKGKFSPIENHPLAEGIGVGRACACGDANNDGLPEIFVGNARQPNFYYRNLGGWNFEKIANGAVIEDLGYAYGASWADYDDDGDLDLFVANFDKENLLLNNDGLGNFTRITNVDFVTEKGGASKGHSWGDYDNDGDLDIYIGNGTYKPDMRNFLYLNNGNGDFERYTNGVLNMHADTTAGVAHSDFDRDGDLDLFVANWGSNDQINRLYINQTTGKNWIAFRLKGTKSNTEGIGAHLELFTNTNGKQKSMHRWMYPITGYGSQNDSELHFGLGSINKVDSIRVHWPSGALNTYDNIQPNNHWLITEDGSIEKIK